jgi:hypothetical protein
MGVTEGVGAKRKAGTVADSSKKSKRSKVSAASGGKRSQKGVDGGNSIRAAGSPTVGQQTSHIANKQVRSETYQKLKHKDKVGAEDLYRRMQSVTDRHILLHGLAWHSPGCCQMTAHIETQEVRAVETKERRGGSSGSGAGTAPKEATAGEASISRETHCMLKIHTP